MFLLMIHKFSPWSLHKTISTIKPQELFEKIIPTSTVNWMDFSEQYHISSYVFDVILLRKIHSAHLLLLVWPCSRTWQLCYYACTIKWWQINGWFRFMVFNATFNNISVISWQSVLLLEDSGVPGNQRLPGACNRSPGSKLLSITTQLHCCGHLGGRAQLPDTILEEDHPMTIPSKFGFNWATGSRQDGFYVNFP